jgi:hypothetical protein
MNEEDFLMTAVLIKYKNGEPLSTNDMKRYLDLTSRKLPKMDAPDMPTLAGLQTQYRSILQNILAMGQKQGQ